MSKHTPEPWIDQGSFISGGKFGSYELVQIYGNSDNRARACACVTACKDMADPAAEITALREEVAKYKDLYHSTSDTSNKLADRIIENHETIFRLRDMVAAAVVARDRLRQCPNTATGAGGQTIDECVARRRYFNVPLAIFDEFGTLLGDMPTELFEQIEKAAEKLTTPGAPL